MQPIIHSLNFFIRNSEARPSPDQLNSPLKKRKATTQIATSAILKSALYGQKKRKLDFSTPSNEPIGPRHQHNQYFVSPLLQTQTHIIEHSLNESSLTEEQKRPIEDKILQILENQSLSEEQKLVELGLLYYYLASGKSIPIDSDPSFFTIRLAALELEVEQLRQTHKKIALHDPDKLISSGVTAYLLHTFIRTIFPPDGGFNVGGCYAIKALLNSPLNLYIMGQMRTQILEVIDCLNHDPIFQSYFQNPFQVHPSIEHLIGLDLQLPPTEKINFIYVRWSLLKALFSELGQINEGNCYAVATTVNLLKESKQAYLKLMIEILQTGHFSFKGSMIPILPLLETRRQYAADLKVEMTLAQAQALSSYSGAQLALNVTPASTEGLEILKMPLEAWIALDFQANAKRAKEFLLFHKLSFMQQAALAAIQFAGLNDFIVSDEESGVQRSILKSIMNQIDISLTQKKLVYKTMVNDLDFQAFKNLFFQYLCNTLFLVDFTHSGYTVQRDRVVFDFHSQGFKFNDHLDYQPFKATRRLFCLLNGEFKPVDKLSDFIQHCVQSLTAVAPETPSKHLKLGLELWKQHFTSVSFRENLAWQIHNCNQLPPDHDLNWQHYDESDTFFLIQRGGHCGLLGGLNAIENQLTGNREVCSLNIKSFFYNLCLWSSCYFKEYPENDRPFDPQILATYETHSLNLTPGRFRNYWNSPNHTKELKERVIEPGLRLMRKSLSRNEMFRVLNYTFANTQSQNIDFNISEKTMSINDYQTMMKAQLQEEHQARFDMALLEVVREFTYSELKTNVDLILHTLGVDVSSQERAQLIDLMDTSKKADYFHTSFTAARLLHKALVRSSKSTCIPIYIIERAICLALDLPEFIELGNLNWVESLSEQLTYSYLVLTFDPLKGSLVLEEKRAGAYAKTVNPKTAESIYQALHLFFKPLT